MLHHVSAKSCNVYTGTYFFFQRRRLGKQKRASVSSCYVILICACIFHPPSVEVLLLSRLIADSLLFFTSHLPALSFLTSTYGYTFLSYSPSREEKIISPISLSPQTQALLLPIYTFSSRNHPFKTHNDAK